jgi:hypothetical protein
MAADTSAEGGPDSPEPNGGANNPFRGSLTSAELTAEIGHWLQAQHPVSKEPLPDNLAALIRRLQERADGAS